MYRDTINLSQAADASKTEVVYVPSKVEVILAKMNGASWATLEPSATAMRSWTTFGTTGKGTVGGKEMFYNYNDHVHVAQP